MTFEQHVQSALGALAFQVTVLTTQLDAALAKKAELEAEIKKLKESVTPKSRKQEEPK